MMRNVLSTVFVFASVLAVAYFLVRPLTEKIAFIGTEHVALVSQMGASVAENPTNKIAFDLKMRSQELDAREQALIERENLLRKEQESVAHRTRNILATTIGFSVLTLLLLHAYTKHRHDLRERAQYSQEKFRTARTLNTGLRVSIERMPHKHHLPIQ